MKKSLFDKKMEIRTLNDVQRVCLFHFHFMGMGR